MNSAAGAVNPLLQSLHPYPFEKYRVLLGDEPSACTDPLISLAIGEPAHPTPALILDALKSDLDAIGQYPTTAGSMVLREAIAGWLERRFAPVKLDPARNVLPVLGTREALFAIAQTVIDPHAGQRVICPNPFYQIYEGAALMAGAQPEYVPLQAPGSTRTIEWSAIKPSVWQRTRLVYVCSPGNPTGSVISQEEWVELFTLADQFGFVIAADECYSELYRSDDAPPVGCLQAAAQAGRELTGLMAFGSLSKRSNAPGLRSGYVAGDPALIERFLQYRTYHGSAMSLPVQTASIAAWSDEAHVQANRAEYDRKFEAVIPLLSESLTIQRPQAGFYLWAGVRDGNDPGFCQKAYQQYNVKVLPGSYLGREIEGENPGSGRVRIALVDTLERCVAAANRLQQLR